MNALRALIKRIDQLNEMVGRLMGWLTILMVVNVFVVVCFALCVFAWLVCGCKELYIWIHATVFMLGAGYTLMHDGHVRIDLIYRTASPRYKAIVDILGRCVSCRPTDLSHFHAQLAADPAFNRQYGAIRRSRRPARSLSAKIRHCRFLHSAWLADPGAFTAQYHRAHYRTIDPHPVIKQAMRDHPHDL